MATTQIDLARQGKAGTLTDAQIAAGAAISDAKLGTSYVKADGTRALTGDQSFGGNKATNLANGIASTDAATVGQLTAAINGQDLKQSARVTTDGSETYTISGGAVSQISGTTISGVTLNVADRVLVKNAPTSSGAGVADTSGTGSTSAANGVYVVSGNTTNLTLTRSTDADGSGEVTDGLTLWVGEGTSTYRDTQWTLSTNDSITIGTTALTFMQTGGAQVSVDSSLTKTGNQLGRAALTGDVTAAAGSNATTIAAGAVTLSKQAALAANSVVGNATGSAATPTAVPMTAAPTPSSVVFRDASGNVKVNSIARGVTTTATAGSTTTLTVASTQFQQFTGTAAQTIVLPDATTLVAGQQFTITDRSTGALTVNTSGGSALVTIGAGGQATVTLVSNGTSAGTWDVAVSGGSSGLSVANFVTRETPSGSVNGSNATFTLANTPISGTEHVYLNGILQEPGTGNDYTISGATITWLTPVPVSGDKIRVSYQK